MECAQPEPRSQRDGKWLVGQGVATAYYPFLRFPAKARVRICADGTAIVQTPASEMGMGTATAQIQHAADRLGLPLERVTFQYGDSSLPDTPMMAGGSNQTATIFAAVQAAVEQVHRELLKLAQKRSRFAAERREIRRSGSARRRTVSSRRSAERGNLCRHSAEGRAGLGRSRSIVRPCRWR